MIGDHLLDGDGQAGCESPDKPADPRAAEKEVGIGGELNRLRRLPPDKAIGPVADGLPPERRRPPLVARHRAQEMRRQDPHVVDGIIEHLAVALPEAEDRGERIPRGDLLDALQLWPERRCHHRIIVGVERELDVGGSHRLAVLPVRARVEVEHQRQRPIPLPPLREQRLEIFVAVGIGGHADVGELEKQLLADVARDDVLGGRRQQRGGLNHRGVDQRAAARRGAAAAALAGGECDDGQNDV